jgi:endo-1,4-beta-xylanase
MRLVITFATVIAASIVALGVMATHVPDGGFEIVPPLPVFGSTNRIADTSGVAPPYGDDRPSLRELAQDAGLLIGAAVEPEDMTWEPLYNPLVAREFNIITTENVLKFGLVRKTQNRYVFGPADVIVDFAAQNGLQVRGHTLVWHEQLPQWLKVADLSREELSAMLEEHIKTVVGRYEGRIQYWDVLNEAIDWDGSLRDTLWLEKLGPDYMDQVFYWAHEADPDAKLYYNDFAAEGMGSKSDGVYELVKGMVERGVPIDGVGFQGHFTLEDPPNPDDVRENIERIAALGLEVQFTEVDVRYETGENGASDEADEKLGEQAGVYWNMLSVCVENPACTGFITWGVTDKFSWITSFLDGHAGGLLFDEGYEPKPAYWALRDVLERRLNLGSYAVD